MIKKIRIIIALLLVALSVNAKEILLPTSVQIAKKASYMLQKDVNEALSLAVSLSTNYSTVSFKAIDSLRKTIPSQITKINMKDVAEKFGTDKIIYASLNTLNNVIHTELIIKSISDSTYIKKAEGWSVMNYRDILTEKPIYVPSVICAFQRTFAKAMGDSMMYDSYRNDYRVYPAEALIVCGLEYIDNDSLPKWQLFDKKQLSSYDAIENIATIAAYHPDYAVFDIASRDTLWGMTGNYEVSNFHAATVNDIKAMSAIGAKYFVTGSITRIKEGSEVSLRLFEINAKEAKVLKTKTKLLEKDRLDQLRFTIKYLSIELLFDDIPKETREIIKKQSEKTQKAKEKRKAKNAKNAKKK